jgi:ABC-type phosphate transport system permease subunit
VGTESEVRVHSPVPQHEGLLGLAVFAITASEALRAVPQSLREGGYEVGTTKWEVIRTLVLPRTPRSR